MVSGVPSSSREVASETINANSPSRVTASTSTPLPASRNASDSDQPAGRLFSRTSSTPNAPIARTRRRSYDKQQEEHQQKRRGCQHGHRAAVQDR